MSNNVQYRRSRSGALEVVIPEGSERKWSPKRPLYARVSSPKEVAQKAKKNPLWKGVAARAAGEPVIMYTPEAYADKATRRHEQVHVAQYGLAPDAKWGPGNKHLKAGEMRKAMGTSLVQFWKQRFNFRRQGVGYQLEMPAIAAAGGYGKKPDRAAYQRYVQAVEKRYGKKAGQPLRKIGPSA